MTFILPGLLLLFLYSKVFHTQNTLKPNFPLLPPPDWFKVNTACLLETFIYSILYCLVWAFIGQPCQFHVSPLSSSVFLMICFCALLLSISRAIFVLLRPPTAVSAVRDFKGKLLGATRPLNSNWKVNWNDFDKAEPCLCAESLQPTPLLYIDTFTHFSETPYDKI